MCITSAPAKLSNTYILCMQLDEKYHLTAYANQAENLSEKPNAMIFPIPGKLTKDDFYDTTDYANFLKEIEKTQNNRFAKSLSFRSAEHEVQNFAIGMYNVFLSTSATAIRDAVAQLPDDKRPVISDELFSFFNSYYEGWSFVVAAFDSGKKMDSQPIMFKYEPMDAGTLFFPGMDAHDGGAPNINAKVDVDHFLITDLAIYKPFEFQTKVPDFLKEKKLIGRKWRGTHCNGDWYHNVADQRTLDMTRSSQNLINTIKNIVPTEEAK